MQYLKPANIEAVGGAVSSIQATDKHVIILGGGDTGADCLGTAHRQGAASVTQIELMPQPTPTRPQNQPWPTMPTLFKVTSAHEEGGDREYAMRTKEFRSSDNKSVSSILVEHLVYSTDGTVSVVGEEEIAADLVFIAAGFVGPEINGLDTLERDSRDHIKVDTNWKTVEASGELSPVFAAGDAVRGQSLIVWAIAEGRSVAAAVHAAIAPAEPALPSPLEPYEKSWFA
jgi:glutamate synthase (NADPH/NADH) small chain